MLKRKWILGKGTGLFLVRVAVGSIFLSHGLMKLMDMNGTISMFQNAFHIGPTLAWINTIIEVLGGVAMILGIGTYITGILLSIVMFVVIFHVKIPAGNFANAELETLLLAGSFAVALAGPGRFALGPRLCNCCKGGVCPADGKCNCHLLCGTTNCGGTCGCGSGDKCGCGTCAVGHDKEESRPKSI